MGAYRPSPKDDGILRFPVLGGGARPVEGPFLGLGEDRVGQGGRVVDTGRLLLGCELGGPFGDEVRGRG